MNTMTVSPGREAIERCMSLQDGRKQLLPGIPDEITLLQIVPKLPWKAFYILSLVSRPWLEGIRGRRVYDARAVSHSAETLLIVCYRMQTMGETNVALCSMKDHSYTRLPRMPYEGKHRRWGYDGDHCQWVSLNEKIYLLAAEEESQYEEDEDGQFIDRRDGHCSNNVFVLDLAGQGEWKECASLNERRTHFGCGVLHGKIYVFGGLSAIKSPNPSTICQSEVYDPDEDSWSPTTAMTTLRFGHCVEAVGDELFVFGGRFNDPNYLDSKDDSSEDDDTFREDQTTWLNRCSDEFHIGKAYFFEVYHPVKDEWRVENPSDSIWHLLLVCGTGETLLDNFGLA